MGATHLETHVTISKKRGYDQVNLLRSNLQKLYSFTEKSPPPTLVTAGGGINTGAGTSFPILYPINQKGSQGATVDIDLANQALHYQKLVLTNPGGPITVKFNNLIKNRAVLFSLDITVGTASLPTINWPATLFNLPTTLPTTNGSRYVLEIVGFKDDTEERYYVVNGTGGSSSSTLWSTITIDVNKNMQGFNLSNLSAISFGESDGKLRQIAGPVGTGMTFDLGTVAGPLSGENYYFKNSNVEIFRIEAQDVLSSVSIYPSTSALNLGDNAGHNKWQNIFLNNRAFLYEGATAQFLQIYKSQTTHHAVYDIEDVVNTKPGHLFFVNGGAAIFSIISNDAVYSQLDIVPTTDVTKSLGAAVSLNRWNNIYMGGRLSIYENTGSTFLQIYKDTITHRAIYDVEDGTHTLTGHSFFVNGGANLFSIIGGDSVYSGLDLVPIVDNSVSLGAITFNRWKNLHLSNKATFYQGISTTQFMEVYKSASIRDGTFNINDSTPHTGFSFFVNGGTAVFQIQGGDKTSDKIFTNLSIAPLFDNDSSLQLGSASLKWSFIHSVIDNIYEAGSTSRFLQIRKDNTNHYAIYDFNDSLTTVGHLFLQNGDTSNYLFAAEADGIFLGKVQHYQVTRVTSGTFTAANKIHVYYCNCAGGNVNITLPPISSLYPGKFYRFIKTDSSTNHVIINKGQLSDNIVGNASLTIISQWGFANLISDGVNTWGAF